MFKKIVTALLASAMLLSVAACGKKPNEDVNNNQNEENNDAAQVEITDSLELLNTVWALYADEEKFPAAGGDYSEANMSMDGPGRYALSDAEAVQATLNFPAAEIAKIDDAASLIHMMNLNTFTCGAYRTVEGTDMAALAKAIETQVMGNQWMCGFPEKMFVASVGEYLVSAYGNGELIDNLKAKLTEAYPSAEVLFDQNIE